MKKLSLTFLLLTLVPSLAWAQDEEDPFANHPGDTVADPTQQVNINPLDKSFRFFGALKSDSAYIAGFDGAVGDVSILDQDVFFLMQLKGGIDLRPDPSVRIFGIISTTQPQSFLVTSELASNLQRNQTIKGGATTSAVPIVTDQTFNIEELFVDYTIKDLGYIRSGKFVLTWGQGRLFNPGNLPSGIEEGITVQTYLPLFGSVLTSLINARWKYFQGDISKFSIGRFGVGSLFETTLGPINLGFSFFRQDSEGATGDMYLKTTFLGMDVFAEGLLFYQYEGIYQPSFVGGFSWEGGSETWKVRLAAEYYYNGKGSGPSDQSVGAAFVTDKILDTRLAVQWYHSLTDSSGQVVPALQNYTLPNVALILAAPLTYGNPGSKYVEANADPKKRWLAPTFRISLNVNF